MSGVIPRKFIDELLLRVNIVDLIDSHVPLKKTGKEFSARCPFHNEKTPSFHVNPQKQVYLCRGCGESGNAISFLMAFNHLDFVEAVEDLAAFAGVEAPREAFQKAEYAVKTDLSKLYRVLEAAAEFYAAQLRSSAGKQAVEYLKSRGVSGEVARDFGLGYSPDSWDALLSRFDRQGLMDAGMLVLRDDGRVYDRFRGRLMFPIRDKRKRVIGFGGRVLDDSLPKYLNSPETALFSKGKELYGLCELLEANSKPSRILIVEGYMDVIALRQFGVSNSVAALGTATSKAHIDVLFRFASELVFCFDGDNAGRQAAWRAIEAALPCLRDGRQIRIMLLPLGQDPDSLVRQEGLAGFTERIHGGQVLSDYFFEHVGSGLDAGTMEGRSQLLARAKPELEKIPLGFFREMMFERLRELSKVRLLDITEKPAKIAKGRDAGKLSAPRPQRSNLMRKALSLLIQNPHLAKFAEREILDMEGVDVAGADLLRDMLSVIAMDKPETSGSLLEFYRDRPQFKTVLALSNLPPEISDGDIESEFRGALSQLIKESRKKMMNALIEKVGRGERLTSEEAEVYKTGGKG